MSDAEPGFLHSLTAEQTLLLSTGIGLGLLGILALLLALWLIRRQAPVTREPGPKRQDADRVGWILLGDRSPES